jgi:putative transposase
MAKPYSIDLRERVVGAVVAGGLSRHRAASQFGVAVSTVIGWVRRFKETGGVAPSQMGGYKPRKIIGAHEAWLAGRIQAGDFTLHGLVAELAGRGLAVDYHTVWDFVHAARFSYKKRRWSPASGSDRMSPAAGRSG